MFIYRFAIAFFLILLFVKLQPVCAQNGTERDYRKFQKEFSEVEFSGDSIQKQTYILHPASLPIWLYKIPQPGDRNYYSIGISDPGMEYKEALEMAVIRAKCIYAFLVSPNVSSLADNYSDERTGNTRSEFDTKYISYFQVRSDININDSLMEVVDTFYTSFKEAIVLIKMSNGQVPGKPFTAEADVYQVERQKTGTFEMEEKYSISGIDFSPCHDSSNFNYEIHAVNNIYEITSEYNQVIYNFPYLNYRYNKNTGISINDSVFVYKSKLTWGLWKSFTETFMHEIFKLSQNRPVAVKQVGDDYTTRTQHLSRELITAKPAIKISCINVENNHLFLKMDYLN